MLVVAVSGSRRFLRMHSLFPELTRARLRRLYSAIYSGSHLRFLQFDGRAAREIEGTRTPGLPAVITHLQPGALRENDRTRAISDVLVIALR
jgi:hypothetical protein